MDDLSSKRQFLIGGGSLGFAALVSGSSIAQEQPKFTAEQIGKIHSQSVVDARTSVVKGNVFSRDSLIAALQSLVEVGVIKDEEAKSLLSMIDVILNGTTLNAIIDEVNGLFDKIATSLGQIARTIAAIIRDSAQMAPDLMPNQDIQRVIRAIAADVSGAIQGAKAGSNIPAPDELGPIIGALAGAAAASIIGYYQEDLPPQPKAQ
jgi:hypothetical protein